MATTMTAPKTEEWRAQAAEDLQAALVELLDLALQGKQAHWNVTGPRFRPLHLQLDEMVEQYRTWSDQVAERVTALGTWPEGQARQVTEETPFAELPAGPLPDEQVVAAFVERLTAAADRLRKRVERLDQVDLVSQGVLLEVLGGIEEQLWMLRAQQT